MVAGLTTVQRDLNRMEKWANMNLLKFNKGNKGKCKVLPQGWNNLSTG